MMVTTTFAQWSILRSTEPEISLCGAIMTLSEDVVLVGGKDSNGLCTIIRSIDRGETFQRTFTIRKEEGNQGLIRSFSRAGSTIVFAAGGNRAVYSVDGGVTWKKIADLLPDSLAALTSLYMWNSVAVSLDSTILLSGKNRSGDPVLLRGSLRARRWDLDPAFVEFNRMQFVGKDLVKAHEYDGVQIYESRDAGKSWMPLWQPIDYSIWDMCFLDSLHGWYASGDGARRTTDGGNTWLNSPLSRCSTICFADTSTGWMLDYNFLGHSTDGGRTYQDQSKNVENVYRGGKMLAVASNQVAYYSTGRIVYQTKNGGGLTSSLNEGRDDQSPSTDEIVIHPNPSDEWCEMSLRTDIVDHIQLFDDTGRLVRSVVVTDRNTYTLNTADLPSGVYRVIVRGEHTSRSKCLVIVH